MKHEKNRDMHCQTEASTATCPSTLSEASHSFLKHLLNPCCAKAWCLQSQLERGSPAALHGHNIAHWLKDVGSGIVSTFHELL